MKKIIVILLVATIPAVLIIGGLYVTSELKMNKSITEAVDKIEKPYYKGIASTCFKKDKSEYQCCLDSVEMMREAAGWIAPEAGCVGMQVDQLPCLGSFAWCVPPLGVVTPDAVNNSDRKSCVTDDDCVPSKCCHAADVVNKAFAPRCGDVMCTMSCETVLDCGQGAPVCNEGVCDIAVANDTM